MRFGRLLILAAMAAVLASGCGKSTGLMSPGVVRGALELTGTVVAVEYGHPYDADFVMQLETAPGASRVAFVEARLQVRPDQLPFESDTPLGQIAVGDRVHVRGVPQGERLRMLQLRRLEP